MLKEDFTFNSRDGKEIFVNVWLPEKGEIKGIVQIAHGMAEHAGRYERFAKLLTEHGYGVYANDHRGHGKTAGELENLGYLADEDGFKWLVDDLYDLSKIIEEKKPGIPLFLFGHSMGSFVAQRYIMLHGDGLKGTILSGSNGKQGIILNIGSTLAKMEIKKNGKRAPSPRLDNLSFGSFNKLFKPNRTKFDWLSRDDNEVDKYIEDPYCGSVFTCGFFYDFFTGLKEIENDENLKKVPKNLPIYIFSGANDPVGKSGKGVVKLFNRYKNYGIEDIEYKLYKDGRHEMLNEINRDEVMEDVVNWLDRQI